MDGLPAQIILQVIFILLNAFFAGSEIAFLSLNQVKLNKKAEDGDKTAARLLVFVENPNRFLSAIQVAITLSGFLGAAFGAESFSGYLTDAFVSIGIPLPEGTLSVISMVLITIIISFFSIAFGEMVPKRIAMQRPDGWAKAALGIMKVISFAGQNSPLVSSCNECADLKNSFSSLHCWLFPEESDELAPHPDSEFARQAVRRALTDQADSAAALDDPVPTGCRRWKRSRQNRCQEW